MRRWISEGSEAGVVQQKKIDASPKRADFEREFGKDKVKDEGGGEWSLSLKEDHQIKRAIEMQEGTRKIEIERGAEMQARLKRERVIRKVDGKMVEFPEEMLDQAKDKFIPAGRNGRTASLKFGLSDAFRRYEQGPDGLWFVWDGGWEPTELWRNAAEGPQRDPDGNEWVERNGEWFLGDEVD